MDPTDGAEESIRTKQADLLAISHRIHGHPELAFEEEQSSGWLADALTDAGFSVETGVCDLPTAFIARAGSGPLHLAICAEYDALPGVGHACGHNIIAAMTLGAGIGVARVADEVGLTVSVIGTPAEEGGGGKIMMLERGAFDGVHAAMMAHPAPADSVAPRIIASARFTVDYWGKAAHASAFPELGINAQDAMTIAQTSIGLLRQHMRPTDRVHGIITHGGDAPNIIPAHTQANYSIRGRTVEELEELRPRILRCFEAGALATGATLDISGETIPYAEMRHDPAMAAIYQRHAEALGRTFPDPATEAPSGSTDMGNVSLAFPSIHPMIGLDSLPAVNHQPEFTAYCITEAADKAVMDGSLAMAWTAIDMARDDGLRRRLIERV